MHLQERKYQRIQSYQNTETNAESSGRPYQIDKENISANHPTYQYAEKNLHSRTIGDNASESSSSQPDDTSSLSDGSSKYKQANGAYDSMLIEKHRQVKQEFEEYKQSFGAGQTNAYQMQQTSGYGMAPSVKATTNVFSYGGTTYGNGLQ